jgi:hypothetical protein
MRRSFDKLRAITSLVLGMTGGVDPETGEKKAAPKQRFVFGDHFYMNLNYKRVNGKWRVKR